MTTDDVRNLNLLLSRAFVYGGQSPPYPPTVSDDDTVDKFPVDNLGYFSFFEFRKNWEKTVLARRKILVADKNK